MFPTLVWKLQLELLLAAIQRYDDGEDGHRAERAAQEHRSLQMGSVSCFYFRAGEGRACLSRTCV
jgi:hypothetical protein